LREELCGDAIKALTGKLPEPRRAGLARVRDPASGEMIDEALALWFPGPASFTGEDCAEAAPANPMTAAIAAAEMQDFPKVFPKVFIVCLLTLDAFPTPRSKRRSGLSPPTAALCPPRS